MVLNLLPWEKGGGYTTSWPSGGGTTKGCTGRSGWGNFAFLQEIYELELWWKMWPHNMPPVLEDWKRRCA